MTLKYNRLVWPNLQIVYGICNIIYCCRSLCCISILFSYYEHAACSSDRTPLSVLWCPCRGVGGMALLTLLVAV